MNWSHYLFSFHGRVNRARMWLFYVVVWIMEMVVFLGVLLTYAILVMTGLVGRDTIPDTHSPVPGIGFVAVLAVFFAAVTYMNLAVLVKRLHDRNRSAWWLAVFLLIPAVAIVVPEILAETGKISVDNPPAAILVPVLVGVVLYFWGFIELYCLRGTIGDNRFGPDPLAGRL